MGLHRKAGKNSRTNRATSIWPVLAYSLTMLLACLLSLPAMAQAVRGQVRGLVTDQSGSVLPGAKVTLSNVNTGVITTKPTDSAGIYVFDFVEPGTYTVTVEAGGFARHVQQNLVVQSSSELTVDAMLTPGALQQSVTVTAAPPLLETTSSNVELTIDTKMANDTPRLDRNPFKLTLIEPAAVNTRGEMDPYRVLGGQQRRSRGRHQPERTTCWWTAILSESVIRPAIRRTRTMCRNPWLARTARTLPVATVPAA